MFHILLPIKGHCNIQKITFITEIKTSSPYQQLFTTNKSQTQAKITTVSPYGCYLNISNYYKGEERVFPLVNTILPILPTSKTLCDWITRNYRRVYHVQNVGNVL